jgi:hypothetical protein
VAGNAGDDAAEDERRDDHANEAQEDVSEEVSLRSDLGRVHAQFSAGKHCEKSPGKQGAAAGDEGKKETETDPAKADGKHNAEMKEASGKTGGEEQDGCQGERAKSHVAGLRERRSGSLRHQWALKVRRPIILWRSPFALGQTLTPPLELW